MLQVAHRPATQACSGSTVPSRQDGPAGQTVHQGRPCTREGRPVADSVLHEVNGAVATITINRPAARNALTADTKVALLEALRDCSASERVRAVIITGAGQAFCSGQDLREHADLLAAGSAPLGTVRQHYNPMIETIAGMAKPV